MENKSVMTHNDQENLIFEQKIRKEYDQAVKEGFLGSFEEYIELRDYL